MSGFVETVMTRTKGLTKAEKYVASRALSRGERWPNNRRHLSLGLAKGNYAKLDILASKFSRALSRKLGFRVKVSRGAVVDWLLEQAPID